MTLLVDRPDAERVTSNHADADVDNMVPDFVIRNHSTLQALKETCRAFTTPLMQEHA
jgi:hypothetical protein